MDETLSKLGLRLDKKPDVSPVVQMAAGGLGGIAGHLLGAAAGFGWVGKATTSLLGSILGHVAVTYDVRLERAEPGPSSPMAWSDRR